jgi:hypothetical protein
LEALELGESQPKPTSGRLAFTKYLNTNLTRGKRNFNMQLVCVVVLLAVLLVQSESADDSSCPSNDLHNLSQHDPELMQVIKAEVLMPPPAVKSRPDLNMTEHQRAFKFRAQYGQPFAIQDLFYGKNKKCEIILE